MVFHGVDLRRQGLGSKPGKPPLKFLKQGFNKENSEWGFP